MIRAYFNNTKIRDVVSLNRYPFKHFKVVSKTKDCITLKTVDEVQRTFTKKEFNNYYYYRDYYKGTLIDIYV